MFNFLKTIFKPFTHQSLLIFICSWYYFSAFASDSGIWNSALINITHGNIIYQIEPQLRITNYSHLFERAMGSLGLGYFYSPNTTTWVGATTIARSVANSNTIINEQRLWQQIIHSITFSNATFMERIRFEQRRVEGQKEINYRLRTRFIFNKTLTDSIFLSTYDELFVNFNQPQWVSTKTFDQNRIYIGINQNASPQVIVGMGYIYQLIFNSPSQHNHLLALNAQFNF